MDIFYYSRHICYAMYVSMCVRAVFTDVKEIFASLTVTVSCAIS